LGNKIKVWAYNAETLELINGSPFTSLLESANYFNVNYRTIIRHLDTKLASMQNKLLVYFFKKELDSQLKNELKKPNLASYTRSEIWVYTINDQGKLILIPNQPFKTKCEVIRVLGIHLTTLNNHLNTFKLCKNLLFFTSSQH